MSTSTEGPVGNQQEQQQKSGVDHQAVLGELVQQISSPQVKEWFQKGGQNIILFEERNSVGYSGQEVTGAALMRQGDNLVLRLRSGGAASNKEYSGSGNFVLLDGVFRNDRGLSLESSPVFIDMVADKQLDPEKINRSISEAISVKPLAELSPEQHTQVVETARNLYEARQNIVRLVLQFREEQNSVADTPVDEVVAAIEEKFRGLQAAEEILEQGEDLLATLQFDPQERLKFNGVGTTYEARLSGLRREIRDLRGSLEYRSGLIQQRVQEASRAQQDLNSADSLDSLRRAVDRLALYSDTVPGNEAVSLKEMGKLFEQIQETQDQGQRDALIQNLPDAWGIRSRVSIMVRSNKNLAQSIEQSAPVRAQADGNADGEKPQGGRLSRFFRRVSGRG